MDAKRNRGLDYPIGLVAIALERPGGVNDDIGRDRTQLRLDLALAIERGGDCRGSGAERGAERLRLGARAPRNDERQPRFVGEKLRQSAAEGAIAAEDEDSHR